MTSLLGRVLAVSASALLLVGCGSTPGQGSGAEPARAPAPRATMPDTAPSAQGSVRVVRPPARSIPVGLRIPAIGVDTPVMRLGLSPDGTVEVPPITADDLAGWYEHSPTPGETGPSVLLGHVTVGSYGDGVFRHLARLRRGEAIDVRLENGVEARFTVTDVRTVAKSDFPTEEVYGDVDRPELRLITCGGPRDGHEYRDNVIVFAVLDEAGPGGRAGSDTGAGVR
ncbi:class F sortase [Streptomyces sp. NPDC055051]